MFNLKFNAYEKIESLKLKTYSLKNFHQSSIKKSNKMTKLIIMFTMIITGMVCKAQVSENRNVSNFSQIQVSNGIELIYHQSEEAASIRVETTSEEVLKSVKTDSNKGILKIYRTLEEMEDNSAIKVFVTGNNLKALTAKSKARIVFQNITNFSNMTITLSTGAHFNGWILSANRIQVNTDATAAFNGRIETQKFTGNFKNKSKIILSGTAAEATINATNKAYCHAKNFVVDKTNISSNDATVIITSKNKLAVDLTENAQLTYFGQPKDVNIKHATNCTIEKTKTAKILLASK